MEKINAVVKKWGNSYGIVLPKKFIDNQKLKDGSSIEVFVQSKNKMTVGDLFELGKKNRLHKLKKSTEQLMKEVDEKLWPEE